MKKIISLVLSLVLIFTVCIPVFAANEKNCDCGVAPIIYVAALGSATIYENPETENQKALFRPDTASLVGEAVKKILPVIPSLVIGDFDTFGDALIEFVNSAFGALALDGDGNSKANVYAPVNEPEDSVHGVEHSFYFGYDFRLDPYEHADRLYKTVQKIKELTGHEKVQFRASSMGGVVAMAYLERYGTQDLQTVIFQNCPIKGTAVAGELFCGKVEINKDALLGYALDAIPSLENDFLQAFLYSLACSFDDLGVWSLLVSFADELVLELKDRVYDECLIPIFGSMPGIWSFVPDEYYEDAKKIMVNENTQSGLIQKIDAYHYNVQEKAAEILNKANSEINIYNVVGYDIQRTPLVTAHRNTSDGTVDTKYAAAGAVCADIKRELSANYTQKVSDGHNHISPDNKIDASSCALPEQTWFIKDMLHCTTHSGHDALYKKMYLSKEQFTVWTFEEYPQFLQNNIPDESFYKVKKESAAEIFKNQPNLTNFTVMIRDFINTVKNYFEKLFISFIPMPIK